MQLIYNLLFALLNFWKYKCDPTGLDSIAFTVLHLSIKFRTPQQTFAWNASTVKTGSSQLVLFNNYNFLAKLSRPDRRYISTGSASQYSYIARNRHMRPPLT
ncbi:hypothetical protein D3C81_1813180 [compost metagenome]